MAHDHQKHNHGLYLSVQPISTEDSLSLGSLAAKVTAILPSCPENEAYLSALMPSTALPRVKRQRLTALDCGLSLIREVLPEVLPSLRLHRDENGRPYATVAGSAFCSFDFNLSHTEGYVACGLLTGDGQIGVDIEPVMAEDRARKLLPRFFSEAERAHLSDPLEGEDFATEMTRVWTAKEALCKQDGRGFPPDFDSLAVPSGLILYHGRLLHDPQLLVTVCAPHNRPLPQSSIHSLPILWEHMP